MLLLERHTGVGTQPANSGCGPRFKENVMSKSATFVRHKAKPGRRDDLRRVWDKYVRDYVAGNDGALSCYYCYDDNDPDTVIVFQLAADQAIGQEFVKQPWFADYQRETAALLDGSSELRTATPQWVKGAAA
jgi:quinol monooxygenase YgiN